LDKDGARGDTVLTFDANRSAEVHVPAGYDPSLPTMLVLNLHGFTSDIAQEKLLTQMNESAEAKNYIVVYPQGIGNSFDAGDCCGQARDAKLDDVAFVREIVGTVASRWCVDPKRIYATGMSNGGFMAHRLACEMSDVFAAIAPVAGVLGVAPETCKPNRPMPVLHFHGTADAIVPYHGGRPLNLDIGYDFRSVADSTDAWRAIDGCAPASKVIYEQGDARCEQWDCAAGSEVTLCTIEQGGHTWPGGFPVEILPVVGLFLGKTSKDIDATNTMITFFERHPMP
jgi:polyhydroxybutyrate depolymerase